MTNQEILTKAVQKAIANGLRVDFIAKDEVRLWHSTYDAEALTVGSSDMSLEQIIFKHDFAKALWGEVATGFAFTPPWQYHLQQMVIAEDPIKYLGENLPNKAS